MRGIVTIRFWAICIVVLGLAGDVVTGAEVESPAKAQTNGGLMVVAPQNFHAALGDYVRHKEGQLEVQLVALETILRENEGADDPERLKRYLYGLWQREKIQYVLLAGDADVMPVRYMALDRITAPAFDYSFYPSDLYYGDLAKGDGSFEDWNGQREGFHSKYYGEVRGEKNKEGPINFDGIDYLPEVAVGRWPVSTVDEVKIVAAKTIRYEKGLLAGEKPNSRRVAMIQVGGWVDCRGAMDGMAEQLKGDWMIEKRYYTDENKNYQTPPPTAGETITLMNEGLGIICHAGHGEDMRWDQSLALADLPAIHNGDRLPVVFSAGCSTARLATLPPYEPYVDSDGVEHKGSDHGEVFNAPPPPPAAYQKGTFNPPGMGEGLLRNGPDGVVAYMGCNTGSQPCGITLMEGFVAGLDRGRLGDCWNHAIAHYHAQEHLTELKPTESWYPPSIFFQGMKFMLFGDPSLLLPGAGLKGGYGKAAKDE